MNEFYVGIPMSSKVLIQERGLGAQDKILKLIEMDATHARIL